MAITRVRPRSPGAWTATTYAELALIIHAEHGAEAYVTGEGSWYKFDKTTGNWRQLNTSVVDS